MGKVGELFVVLDTKLDRFNKGMSDAERAMVKVGTKFTAIGKKLSMMVTLPILAVGAGAVKAFADFDKAMTESLAIMGPVSDSMRKKMGDVAKTISEETIFAASELAESYYYLASAGMTAEQSVAALDKVARFAQAGAFDLATATDLLTDAQTAMGLSSKDAKKNQENLVRVSDVLVGANTLANASVQQFSESLTNMAAAALTNVNKGLEEGVAILAAFADKGIKGQKAGMKLSMMLNALDKAASKNKEAWKKWNVQLWDSQGNMKNVGDIIGSMERAFKNLTPEAKAAAIAEMGFDTRVKNSILSLMGSSAKIIQWTADLKDMGGITEEVAGKQMAAFSNQLKVLRNMLVNAGSEIGKVLAPALTDLIDNRIKPAIKWFKGLSGGTKETIVKVAGLVAAIGPLMLIFGKLLTVLPKIKAAFLALTGPAGLVAAGIAVLLISIPKLIKGFQNLSKSYDDWKKKTEGAVISLDEIIAAVEKNDKAFAQWSAALMTNGNDMAAVLKKLENGTLKGADAVQQLYDELKAAAKITEELSEKEDKLNKIIDVATVGKHALRKSYELLNNGVDAYCDNLIYEAEVKGNLTKKRVAEIEKMREELTKEDLLFIAHGKVTEALKNRTNLTPKLVTQLKNQLKVIEGLIDAEGSLSDETKTSTKWFEALRKKAEELGILEDTRTLVEKLKDEYWALMAKVFAGEVGWQKAIEQQVELKGKIKALTDGLGDLDMALDDDAEAWIDFGDDVNTVLEDMGYGMGSIPDEVEDATTKTKSLWGEMADGLQTKWASTIGEVLRGATSLKDGLKGVWDSVVVQFTDMIGQMVAKWVANFVSKVLTSVANIGSAIEKGIGGAATGAADIISTAGTAAGSLLSTVNTLAIVALAVAAIFNLFKKGADLTYTNKLLEGISWDQLNAINLKLDSVNWHLAKLHPNLNSIRKITDGILRVLKKGNGSYQEGGLVKETGLAYVHKGEWVLPKIATQSLLSPDLPRPANIQPLLRMPGGSQGESVMNATVNIYAQKLDDYTINTAAEKIFAAVERQSARRGG